jgi:MAF protein
MNPLNHLSTYRIVLGSASPRRKELMDKLGMPYKIQISTCEEIVPSGMSTHQIPAYLAELKYDDLHSGLSDDHLLITADTIVIHQDQMLGKPGDIDEARSMISQLSGDHHQVVTAITVGTHRSRKTYSDTAKVWIDTLTDEEIDWYTNSSKILDKAGSYGIQDWLGLCKVTKIVGSYYTIMGMPMHRLYNALSALR